MATAARQGWRPGAQAPRRLFRAYLLVFGNVKRA
jgi:hypothetical protein